MAGRTPQKRSKADLEIIHRLLDLGYQAVKISPETKKPVGKRWNDARRTPEQNKALVAVWLEDGWDIGTVPCPGEFWLDIDTAPVLEGVSPEDRIREKHPGAFAEGVYRERSPGGGLHIRVKLDQEIIAQFKQFNYSKFRPSVWLRHFGPGVDVRLPERGQCIALGAKKTDYEGNEKAYVLEQDGEPWEPPEDIRPTILESSSKTGRERTAKKTKQKENAPNLYRTLLRDIWAKQKRHRLPLDDLQQWAEAWQQEIIGEFDHEPYVGEKLEAMVRGAFDNAPHEPGHESVDIGEILQESPRVDQITVSALLRRRLGDTPQHLRESIVRWTKETGWRYANKNALRDEVRRLSNAMWEQAGNDGKPLPGLLPAQSLGAFLDHNERVQLKRTPADPTDETQSVPWDAAPFRIGLPGGKVLDLTDCDDPQVRDEERDDLILSRLPVEPAAGDHPRFSQFMDEVSLGREDWVNRVLDIYASGLIRGSQWQMMFLMLGRGRNGKGVMLGIIRALYGPLVKSVSHEWRQGSSAHPQVIASLENVGIALYEEAVDGDQDFWQTSLAKDMSGGGVMTGRKMRENDREITKTWTSVYHMNRLPRMRGVEKAMKDRIEVIHWEFSPKTRIQHLDEKIVAAEGPAILHMLIQRAIALRRATGQPNGKYPDPPKCIRDTTEAAWKNMDAISQWLAVYPTPLDGTPDKPGFSPTPPPDRTKGWQDGVWLYGDFKRWNREWRTGEPMGKGTFYSRLEDAGVERRIYRNSVQFYLPEPNDD